MVGPTVPPRSDAVQLAELLNSPEITTLVTELAATRWTGRPGYPIRAMVGMALAKSLYTLPTWTRTVGLVREHAALRTAFGCADPADVPSVHACYRFTAKLRKFKPLLDASVDRVTAALHEQIPRTGHHRRHRRLRHARLRQRPAVLVQGRPRAQAVQRP